MQTLATMTPEVKEEQFASGKMAENVDKNRFPELVASDRHRPYLMTRVHGTNDYINAVFLDVSLVTCLITAIVSLKILIGNGFKVGFV